jgi:hypothetical protein
MRGRLSRAAVLVVGVLALAVFSGCPDGGDTNGGGGGGDAAADTGPDGGGTPCLPSCDWRECGPDPACGLSCGACTAGEVCDKGSCIPPGCTPDCSGVACGRDPVCGAYCGGCPAGETCQAGLCVPGTCAPQCGRRECGPDPECLTSCGTCPAGAHCQDGACVPGACQQECGTRQCGPDPRCGLSCGTCSAGRCVDGRCVGDDCCLSDECGPAPEPGCDGVSCGTCGANEICLAGTCVCQPDCAGRQCGSDGCGGSCGTCPAGCTCDPGSGRCTGCGDEPCCEDRECGVEPCTGTSCGECGADEECSDGGRCIPIGCQPDCGARVCGPDPVCGDSCGTCRAGCVCTAAGQCRCDVQGACANDHDLPILNTLDPVELATECVLALSCVQPECYAGCIQDRTGISAACAGCYGHLAACGVQRCLQRCLADGGGADCTACLDQFCMAAFETCAGIELLPCEPQCANRACGPDPACGVSCGVCPVGEHCEAGACVPGPCLPDCSGRECGLDPVCGAPCGVCRPGWHCAAGRCVEGPCEPQCGDRRCGPDPVCGLPCGVCPPGERCQAGACVPIAPPSGACRNDDDLTILNATDANAVARTCLLSAGCEFNNAACIADCIAVETGLSAACAACFGTTSVCALRNCLQPCLADPGGAPCRACLDQFCLDDFEACSGVTWGGGACVPQCGQRECGPDPNCGASCGTCGAGEACQAGRCVPTVPTDDACANAQDLAILNRVDATQVAQECILAAGCGTDEACIADCIQSQTGISDACAACYGALAGCGLQFCLLTCYQDPGGPSCLACLDENCMTAFEACSGVTWGRSRECVPVCVGDCGDDGCGGSCGGCAPGETCRGGSCTAQPQDACANQFDLAILPTLDFEGLVTTCLLSCWTDEACLSGCVQQETGLSAGCSHCLGAAGICVAENCLNDCLMDPTGLACQDCALDTCGPGFEECSGVPLVIGGP